LGIAGGLAGCGDVATCRNPANCSNRDHFDWVHAGRKEDQRSPLHHLHLLLYSKKNASGAELVFQRCHSVTFLDRAATAYEETYLKGSRVKVSSFGYKELVQKHGLTEYILMVENSGVSISFSRLLSHNMPHPYFSPPKIVGFLKWGDAQQVTMVGHPWVLDDLVSMTKRKHPWIFSL
jgi:hypothetical protein